MFLPDLSVCLTVIKITRHVINGFQFYIFFFFFAYSTEFGNHDLLSNLTSRR